MEYINKLIGDIFAMKFDVVIPISGCLLAILLAFIVFAIRYFGFERKRRKFKDLPMESSDFHSQEYLKNHPEIKSETAPAKQAEAERNSSERKEPVK